MKNNKKQRLTTGEIVEVWRLKEAGQSLETIGEMVGGRAAGTVWAILDIIEKHLKESNFEQIKYKTYRKAVYKIFEMQKEKNGIFSIDKDTVTVNPVFITKDKVVTDPYKELECAMINLQTKIQEFVISQIALQTKEVAAKYEKQINDMEGLLEEAKGSNWVTNLQKHFNS